jgi:hypothetical protein
MRSWPVRKKMIVLNGLILINFAGGAGLFVLTNEFRFAALGISIVVIVAVYKMFLRCPRCGNLVNRHRTSVGGMEWTYWGGNLAPKHCDVCGWDLAKAYEHHATSQPSNSRDSSE